MDVARQLMTPRYRENCLVQAPAVYEIAPCRFCGGHNTTWSEFKDYIWCFDCEIDYYPEHGGIFDGPIPVHLALMMGLSFDRIEISTGAYLKFNPETCDYERAEVQP